MIPMDSDNLPDVPLLVEQGMSVTEALQIWSDANQARIFRRPPLRSSQE
jgi:hypothetical protein